VYIQQEYWKKTLAYFEKGIWITHVPPGISIKIIVCPNYNAERYQNNAPWHAMKVTSLKMYKKVIH